MTSFFKYITLFALTIFFSEISKFIFDYNELLHDSLVEKYTEDQISEFFNLQHKWQGVAYVFIAAYLFIKISLVALLLYAGAFFYNKKEFSYGNIWCLVVESEYIFLFVPIIKIIWFSLLQTSYTLEDIQNYYPFSVLNFVGYKGLETWYIYPLQIINVFEVGYWIILGYGIKKVIGVSKEKGIEVVALSYGSGLLLWVVTIMFFTLNYS